MSPQNSDEEEHMDKLQKIFKHNKCFDIFQDIKVKGSKMFGDQSGKRFVKYKNERIKIEETIDKINLCLKLRAA